MVLSGGALLTGAEAAQEDEPDEGDDEETDDQETDGDESADVDTIACGETVLRALTEDDATGFRSDAHFHDEYVFEGEQGQRVTISMSSSVGDTVLFLLDPSGDLSAFDADSGGNLDVLITDFGLKADGAYTVIATSFWPGDIFDYNLTLQC